MPFPSLALLLALELLVEPGELEVELEELGASFSLVTGIGGGSFGSGFNSFKIRRIGGGGGV